MKGSRPEAEVAARAGMVCAAAMIAQQVGAKAARDALFLGRFEPAALPSMLVGAALASIAFVIIASRAMTRLGPARLVPLAFATSSGLLMAEWALISHAPAAVAVAFYLHVACFGSVMVSGFWSLVGERFDPRTAKRLIGWIAGAGTLGGLAGGLAVERLAGRLGAAGLIPGLALLQVVCAAAIVWLGAHARPGGRRKDADAVAPAPTAPEPSALRLLGRDAYLRSLAAFVVTASVAATIADYLLKSWAAQAYPDVSDLLRFFAAFYTATSLLAFVVQVGLGRRILEALGLARTAAALPLGILLGGVCSFLVPGLTGAAALRGTEAVVRGSLYRLAYELLYAPLAPRVKRATKTLVDVAVDRLGEVLGAALIRAVLVAAPQGAPALLSGLVIFGGAVGLGIARTLHRGYVQALERGLVSRAVELDVSLTVDRTTRETVVRTQGSLVRTPGAVPPAPLPILGAADTLDTGLFLFGVTTPPAPAAPEKEAPAAPPRLEAARDPLLARLAELRSGDAARVRRALRAGDVQDGLLTAQAIRLLAWDEVRAEAREALRVAAPRIVGQLVDVLLDPDEEFAIRRRVPTILAEVSSPRSVDGLLRGLEDRRFEVRYQCGRALARLKEREASLAISEEAVLSAVLREAAADQAVWEGRQLLDRPEDGGESSPIDDFVRARGARSLEHVFTVLSLVLPPQPLRVAFRGLQTDDQTLRGIALEYLESVLPARVRESLWPFLEDDRDHPSSRRSREELHQELMRLDSSIETRLAALRTSPPGAGRVDGDGEPS